MLSQAGSGRSARAVTGSGSRESHATSRGPGCQVQALRGEGGESGESGGKDAGKSDGESGGESPASCAAEAVAELKAAVAEADGLLCRVRLPYVPFPRLAALGRKQRLFAQRLPSYRALITEAIR